MPPKTKSDTALFLLGQPDSALHPEFIEAVMKDGSVTSTLPFKGPCQLPSIEQTAKLYFFLREIDGKKNRHFSQNAIEGLVFGHILKDWNMAGFNTLTLNNAEKHIKI